MSTSPKIQGVIRRGADRKRNGGAPAWRLRALLAVLGVLGALLVAFLPHLLRMRTAETQLYRGMALLNAGDAAGAEAAWKTAAQSAPANPNVHEALGKLYLAQGRLAEARAALNRQADLAPREPHVLCELAEAEYRAAEGGPDVADHALRDAVRAATLEPGCVRAQTVAGSLFLEKDDAARAIAHLERAVAANPADVPLTIHVINTLLQENRLDEARGWAERLAGRYPAFAPAHALLGRMYQLGPQNPAQTEKMRRALAAALRLDPMNALAHAVTGHDLLGRNASKQAVRHLEAARLLGDNRTSLLFDLSRAYRAEGQEAKAETFQREFRRRTAREAALVALRKRLAFEPDNRDVLRRLIDLAQESGDAPGAARYQRRLDRLAGGGAAAPGAETTR